MEKRLPPACDARKARPSTCVEAKCHSVRKEAGGLVCCTDGLTQWCVVRSMESRGNGAVSGVVTLIDFASAVSQNQIDIGGMEVA